jgi:S-formylglutathione hydrolase FrmB
MRSRLAPIILDMQIARLLLHGLLAVNLIFCGCSRKPQPAPDHPRLTANVAMQDVSFHSAALNRDMKYRVIMPRDVAAKQRLPVVYLLHGGDGSFRDWSNYTSVAQYAERGLILVMPEGDDSYYTNAEWRPQDRYEDYIVSNLIADVESRFRQRTHAHIGQ